MGYTEATFYDKTTKSLERIANSLEKIERYLKNDKDYEIEKIENTINELKTQMGYDSRR